MLRKIRLHGKLGELFGECHEFDVSSIRETISALSANFKGFREFLGNAHIDGIGFGISVAGEFLKEEELEFPIGQKSEIDIVPALIGAGDPGFQIVLGAILIGASFVTPGVGSALLYIGAGLVLQGLMGVFMGGNGLFVPASRSEPDRTPSYLFQGPLNNSDQGIAIPIGYGKMFVGSTAISSGLDPFGYISVQALRPSYPPKPRTGMGETVVIR